MLKRWWVLAVLAAACLLGVTVAAGQGLQINDRVALPAAAPVPGLQVMDLKGIDPGLARFSGGFGDGRYIYLVPGFSHPAVRIDPDNFTPEGVTLLDLTQIDPNLYGFEGGFTDGRYGYFVQFGYSGGQPPFETTVPAGRVARVDLRNFTLSGVTVLDLETVDKRLVGLQGGFTDGRYGYFVPHDDGSGRLSGLTARADLWNFTASGVTTLDLTTADPSLRGFYGGFATGPYVYYLPSTIFAGGKVVRVSRDNFTTSGISVLDLASVDPGLKSCASGFPQGRYAYMFCPLWEGTPVWTTASNKAARIDLENFTPSGVTVSDMDKGYPDMGGLQGLFADDRFAYFLSMSHPSDPGATDALGRIDLANWSPSGANIFDLTAADPTLTDIHVGWTNAEYGYLVTWEGKLARFPLFVPRYRLLLPVAGQE